ncbi:MAG: manganese efflux pump [Salinivirgaceae bacterium]
MIFTFYIVSLVLLAIELFLMASITAFFQKKILAVDVFKLLGAAITASLVLGVGIFFGNLVGNTWPQFNNWYAASLFFIFSIKMLFDGFKLNKLKRAVNPIDKQGYRILTVLMVINSFFVGLGFGMLEQTTVKMFYGLTIFTIFALVGYLMGFQMKKLKQGRYELFAALFYLVIAIAIAINN